MTVYADNMRRYARVDRGSGRVVTGRWSHLLADSPAELAAFAARLGLRPDWVQFPGTAREHYDIVEAVRRRAVAAGAVPIYYPRGTDNLILTKRLLASALDAASRGWHVFPLRPGRKIPAVRDWEHHATVDPERIRDLWTVRLQHGGWYVPEPPNVGIACGPSGLVVIDLDLAKPDQDRAGWAGQWWNRDITSGADVLAALADLAGHAVPETYAVATASDGRHLYFTAPAGVRLRNSTGHLGPMIDVRGEGGYVVAAGSHLRANPGRDDSAAEASELVYRLVEDRPPAELPDWLAAAIAADRRRDDNPPAGQPQIEGSRDQALDGRSDAYGAAALRGEVDRVRSAPVGQRNHTLNAAAYSLGQLVAAGALDQDRAVEALTAAAESAGLATAEIAATIDSGLAAGAKRPRAMATASDAPDTRESRAGDPTQPSTNSRPQDHTDAAEDHHSDSPRSIGAEPLNPQQPPSTESGDTNATATKDSDGSVHPSSDSADRPAPEYTIDEHDAALAGWLFNEAFSAWRDWRTPCYPADTLTVACAHEGLPTEGKSDRRFSGRPPTSGYAPAPGGELLDRDVWDAMTQAQRDEWNLCRTDRPAIAAPADARHHPDGEDAKTAQEPRSFETTTEPATAQREDLRAVAATVKRVIELRGDWSVRVLGDAEYAMYRELCDALRRPRPYSADEDWCDDSGADPTDQVANWSADTEERGRADQTGPDWTDDTPSVRETAADAPREATRAVAEAPNSGNGSVAGEDVDQLTNAANTALEARNEPPSDKSWGVGVSEAPSGEPRQAKSLPDKARPTALPEEPPDPHTALDEAIEHARTAVAHLEATRAATRSQSGANPPDAAVHTGRPAYWAEPEIDL